MCPNSFWYSRQAAKLLSSVQLADGLKPCTTRLWSGGRLNVDLVANIPSWYWCPRAVCSDITGVLAFLRTLVLTEANSSVYYINHTSIVTCADARWLWLQFSQLHRHAIPRYGDWRCSVCSTCGISQRASKACQSKLWSNDYHACFLVRKSGFEYLYRALHFYRCCSTYHRRRNSSCWFSRCSFSPFR